MENNKWFYNTKFDMLDSLRAALVTAQSYSEELDSHERCAEDGDKDFITLIGNLLDNLDETIETIEDEIRAVEPMVDAEKL